MEFSTLNDFNRAGLLGCESLSIGDTRKNKLYGDQDGVISVCLSSDWKSYKLYLHLCVCGQWRKRYSSNMSIIILSCHICLRYI